MQPQSDPEMTVTSEAEVLRVERQSLRAYMYAMLCLALLGFVAYAVTQVAATQLDGVISLINAGAAFVAMRLAVISSKPADAASPRGRLALENLYSLFRSLMILGVVILAIVNSAVKVLDYLINRTGTEPHFGLAAVYTALCAVVCVLLQWNHRRNNRSINDASALLAVEATAAKLEALISAGICVSLILVAIIPEGTFLTSASFNVKHIADSVIVLILCVVLIREPVHQIRLEFGRLSGQRADPALDAAVRAAIAAVDAEYPADPDHELTLIDTLAISRGKTTEVELRVSYTGKLSVTQLDELRAETFDELRRRVGPLRLDMTFSDFPIHAPPTKS